MTIDATISAIARKLGEHGWSVIRSDDLAELRIRAHIGDTHRAFRHDALDTAARIREATRLPNVRTSSYLMGRDAHHLATAFLTRHDHGQDGDDARP